jgi:hypothetical protein
MDWPPTGSCDCVEIRLLYQRKSITFLRLLLKLMLAEKFNLPTDQVRRASTFIYAFRAE